MTEDEEACDVDLSKLCCFERKTNEEMVPAGYLSTTIILDAKASSKLNWKKEIEEAKRCVDKGYKIIFDLDLGLFSKEMLPLDHETQFQALTFSCDHFQEAIVDKFQEHVVGMIMGRVELDDLALRDQYVEYITLLANRIDDRLVPFLLADIPTDSLGLFARLAQKDAFGRVQLGLRGAILPTWATTWEAGNGAAGYIGRAYVEGRKGEEPSMGVVMPAYDTDDVRYFEVLEKAMCRLVEQKVSFKLLCEEFVSSEWDGLDTLFVAKSCLKETTKRKLVGFEAAGGTVVEA